MHYLVQALLKINLFTKVMVNEIESIAKFIRHSNTLRSKSTDIKIFSAADFQVRGVLFCLRINGHVWHKRFLRTVMIGRAGAQLLAN